MSRTAAAREGSPAPLAFFPVGLLSRAPLPQRLVDAVAEVLDCEACETDFAARSALLSGMREALQGWLDGAIDTEQTIGRLASLAAAPRSRIIERPAELRR